MHSFDLDAKLMQFGNGNDSSPNFCIKHACTGLQCFGANGSGKSSSMRTVALNYLRAGFGFLILSVKSERETWEEYCRLAGRSEDLVILGENSHHRFDFLKYLTSFKGGAALTSNLLDILTTVIKSADEIEGGSNSDPFWDRSLRLLLHQTITLAELSDSISVQAIYDIIQSAPSGQEDERSTAENRNTAFNLAFEKVRLELAADFENWRSSWDATEIERYANKAALETEFLRRFPKARPFKFVEQYFFETFKTLSGKTKSIVLLTASNFLFSLLQDPVYTLFCSGEITVTPEDTLNGAILLIDLPTKYYHNVGRYSQLLFKYIWQLQVEKRDVNQNGRIACLWSDESSQFITDYDSVFLSTARSSRIAVVYLAQSIHQYYAALSGAKSADRVAVFLGLMATKLFCSNSDITTNKMASELIGDEFFLEPTRSITIAEKFSQSDSIGFKIDRILRPEAFSRLLTGGYPHCKVEAYIHIQGTPMFNGRNFKKISFDQNYK